ncbi:MAG: DNA polymerase I [Dehalococcoidia bacterium]|nr:DNA polymerase I [Dehalococcoidia bacterium]
MAEKKPLLVLFDGNALIHRAFHALPPLAVTRTGEATGAVYGFASMVLKVLAELKPTHYAFTFDYPAPTFRHREFAAYKAQRPPAPEELKSQFGRVRELVEAFNIPSFEVEGYEADDILGTLSRQASAQEVDTIIVTGDMDTLQLVSPRVRVLTPRPGRSFGDTVLYDEERVLERFGIPPSRIADFKGLKGDPSDNIPGVLGIGEKTAVTLIQTFGSVEEIYTHLNEIAPPKVKRALEEGEKAAQQSKRLATIVTDVPIALDLNACAVTAFDRDRVVALFRELEFTSLLGKLHELGIKESKVSPTLKEETLEKDYRVINDPEGLDELVGELSSAPFFAIDLETTSKEPMHAGLVGLSFSCEPGKAYYVPVGHRLGAQLPLNYVLERLKPLIEGSTISKIAHNGKYDMMVLAEHGIELKNLSFDTMIAAYLLGEKALGLKPLAFSKLGVEMTPITDLIGTGAKQISMAYVDISMASRYACADADITGRLARLLEAELKGQGLWSLFSDVEMPLIPVLLSMERNGVALDIESLWAMSQSLGERMMKLEAEIYNFVGHKFNINSTQQLGAVLFDELRLPGGRRTKSGYSTDASVLEGLKGIHPVIEPLLEYRQLTKLKSTYVDAVPALINPRTGRVHTSFNQTGTATGRLSSSDPNLQNIPIRGELGGQVRRAFVACGDCLLLAADYSQIELRVMAHLSQDAHLIAAFHRDEDIHRATASEVFGVPPSEVTPDMRRVAKTVNFGVIYGISDYGLEQATELSREEASRFINTYFERHQGVKDYVESTKRQARERGYVETILGRRRYIPEINSSHAQVRGAAERMAINMPVQGTAADIIKLAMIGIQREMNRKGLESKMILQVHDELVFEVPQGELEEMKGLVEEIMRRALALSVPLKVETKVGKNWGEME